MEHPVAQIDVRSALLLHLLEDIIGGSRLDDEFVVHPGVGALNLERQPHLLNDARQQA